MYTEKLYYKNAYIISFAAKVLACETCKNGFSVILDKTAFFPEGGGQKPDEGSIGEAKVFDVQEENGVIKHFTDRELQTGTEYECRIEWEKRFSRMQNHSGEHIVSGIVHSLYGYDNVGFHMEEEYVTVDFNGELTREQLDEIEEKANAVIYRNEDIICYFPNESELMSLDYRSKLDLTENVRLVKIGNTDLCACCAPHVLKTGEIGVIKILDFMRHRGGVRIVMKCGYNALHDYREKYGSVYAVSNLLSAKQQEIAVSVERLMNENDSFKRSFYEFKQKIAEADKDKLVFNNDISYFITSCYDADMMRTLVNYGMTVSELCVVFSGNDEDGYAYIAGSSSMNMRSVATKINSALNGRGGGKDTMIQGKASASKTEITDFISNIHTGDF